MSGSWDEAYAGDKPPPWDIGRPQPAFVRLADQGLLAGRVLDSGCGTGEHTLLAAAHGATATGVDVSARAIALARAKAAGRGLAVRFETAVVHHMGAQVRSRTSRAAEVRPARPGAPSTRSHPVWPRGGR